MRKYKETRLNFFPHFLVGAGKQSFIFPFSFCSFKSSSLVSSICSCLPFFGWVCHVPPQRQSSSTQSHSDKQTKVKNFQNQIIIQTRKFTERFVFSQFPQIPISLHFLLHILNCPETVLLISCRNFRHLVHPHNLADNTLFICSPNIR